jgi:hypothetical protein
MAKKDERKIQLDPMEWRDAMKEVESPGAKPPAKKAPAKKAPPRKR